VPKTLFRITSIIQVAIGSMIHLFSQLCFDCAGISVMPVGSHPGRNTAGDCARGAEEGFRRCLVPGLTQQDIDQVPVRSMAR
jgi:hypothetical protein